MTAIKDILSPFRVDGSAGTDCLKLAEPPIHARRAILIYGFDDARRALSDMINAFETLARARVTLGPRHVSQFGPLVHQFTHAVVNAWEILTARG